MRTPNKSIKNRLRFTLGVVIAIVAFLTWRLFYIQVYNNDELQKGALEQWTKGIDIKSDRGIIYDRNGKRLAVNIPAYTVWATPAEISDPEAVANEISTLSNGGK